MQERPGQLSLALSLALSLSLSLSRSRSFSLALSLSLSLCLLGQVCREATDGLKITLPSNRRAQNHVVRADDGAGVGRGGERERALLGTLQNGASGTGVDQARLIGDLEKVYVLGGVIEREWKAPDLKSPQYTASVASVY